MSADPKAAPRIKDRDAILEAKMRWPWCAGCGRYGGNGHHVVQKGSPYFGDDDVSNIVVLCGSGTTGCHGAWHGSPYVIEGVRRDAEWVAVRVGRTILDERPDVIDYVLRKLGADAGAAFLLRNYHLDLEDDGI